MARSRGRSRGPSSPRGTLGTLLRTTLAQAGVVRDVLERGAREGRARLDDVRRGRRRDDALARLGDAVLAAVRGGELADIYDLPEAAEALAELDELDAEPSDTGGGEPPWVAPRTRERFDRRDVRGSDDDGTVSSASWRPPPPREAPREAPPPREAPRPSQRPPAPRDREASRDLAGEPGARFAEPRKGGIQFASGDDDDDDLAAYMHPDDVPPRRDKPE